MFDGAMFRIFGDIPQNMNQSDGLILGEKDQEEHDMTLQKVLQSTKEYGVKFSEEKCEFRKTEFTFFGRLFTEPSLKPDPEKIKAVLNCKAPTSKEVRSFLSMVGYLNNCLENYGTIIAPLRKLTQQKMNFK